MISGTKASESSRASLKGRVQVAMIRLTITIKPLVHRACTMMLGTTKRMMGDGKERKLLNHNFLQVKHRSSLVKLGEGIGGEEAV